MSNFKDLQTAYEHVHKGTCKPTLICFQGGYATEKGIFWADGKPLTQEEIKHLIKCYYNGH